MKYTYEIRFSFRKAGEVEADSEEEARELAEREGEGIVASDWANFRAEFLHFEEKSGERENADA